MSSSVPPYSDHGRALLPGTWLAEYEIERVLAGSGDSILYAARDHGLQRQVALREYFPPALAQRKGSGEFVLLSPDNEELFSLGLKAFAHEARLLAHCEHPALAKVLRYWEVQHTGYMVMRWHEGESLQARRSAMPRPPGEAWLRELLVELLGALEVLHAAFAQHREVTPTNLLLQPDDHPVLLGFHAARRILSERGVLAASAASPYAPIETHPEGSHLQQGPWSDLYSLSAVAYFCLTGEEPPSASVRLEAGLPRLLSAAAQASCRRHPGLQYSPGFLTALDWGFELQPQDRPRSAAQWRAVLQQTASPARFGSAVASGRTPDPGGGGPPDLAAGAAVLRMRLPEPGPVAHDSASRPREVAVADASSSARAAPEPFTSATVSRAPGLPEGPLEPGWDADARAGTPSAEPSEEAVRAALDAALGSLPPRDEPPAVGRRSPGGPPSSSRAPSSRRWLWPVVGVLGLMSAAAGWQWKEQRAAQELSRAMAGVAAPPEERAPAAGDAPQGMPPELPARAGKGMSGQDLAGQDMPPVAGAAQGDVLATSRIEDGERDAQGGEAPPPAIVATEEAGLAQPDAAAAEAAPSAEARPAAADEASEPPPPPPLPPAPPRGTPRIAAAPTTPARVEFKSPREACAPRQRFSLYYCMQQQCEKPAFHSHRQCRVLRERDEIE